MTMQQQRFLNSSSSPSSIPSNHEVRLGSSAAHHCGRAIFSDPCPNCGNSKRRLLTLEAETPSASASASATPTPPPPPDIFRRCNSCLPTTPDPATMKRSFSDVTPAPATRKPSIASGRLISPTFLMSSQETTLVPRMRGEQNDDLAPPGLCIDNNSNDNEEENRAGEDDAERESEMGKDTVTFLHKCPCGNKFQFFVLAKPV